MDLKRRVIELIIVVACLSVVLALIVIVGFLTVTVPVEITVERATLNRFNLNTTTTTTTTTTNLGLQAYTLSYDLTADVSVRNPNEIGGVYYSGVEAGAYFNGRQFGSASLPMAFDQGHKSTTMLRPAFVGTSALVIGDSGVADFEGAGKAGVFDVEVRINALIRYTLGLSDSGQHSANCELRLPLDDGRRPNNKEEGFTRTGCQLVYLGGT